MNSFLPLQHRFNFCFVFNNYWVLPLHFLKISAFILSILVLVLSCMPCADAATDTKQTGAKYETVKHTEQQNHDNKADDCSPFCHCACCSGFTINHFIAVLTHTPQYENNPTNSFLSSVVIGIASTIWQPPQLV